MKTTETNPRAAIDSREIERDFNSCHGFMFDHIRIPYTDQDAHAIVICQELAPSERTLAAIGRIICRNYANVARVTDESRRHTFSRYELLK